jgi:hypothetical protein
MGTGMEPVCERRQGGQTVHEPTPAVGAPRWVDLLVGSLFFLGSPQRYSSSSARRKLTPAFGNAWARAVKAGSV